jgi:hypothetical protein
MGQCGVRPEENHLAVIQALRENPRMAWTGMVALGALSGALPLVTLILVGWFEDFVFYSPALLFGSLLGAYLFALGRAGPVRAIVFAALVTASGVAGHSAVFLTIDLGLHGYGSSLPDELVPALSWGFAYGCGVATTAAVLFPEVRSPKPWGRIVVLATVISGSYAFRLYLDPKPYLISGIPVLAVVAVVNAVVGAILGHSLFLRDGKLARR